MSTSKVDGALTNTAPSLWRNRDFLLLWSGQAVARLGSRMSDFALPLLVLALKGSPAQAGLIMVEDHTI